jgi:thioredoxin-dependent peroxiredoxin
MDRPWLGHPVFPSQRLHSCVHYRTRLNGGPAIAICETQLQDHRPERRPVTSHIKWSKDIEETQGHKVNYPLIGDPHVKVAKLYDMLPAAAGGTCDGRTPADNATVRTVFVIGPDKKIKLMFIYPMSTDRNFDEVLRVLDSMQLTAKHNVSTPVNWKRGGDVIISGVVSDEAAKKLYPGGWKAPRPYLRIVPQPK